MRSSEQCDMSVIDASGRLSSLSIVIDDFDSAKNQRKELKIGQDVSSQKPPTTPASVASIKKILDEVEHRKHEFWKLIDEHNAVIENLKKIEKQNAGVVDSNNISHSPIST